MASYKVDNLGMTVTALKTTQKIANYFRDKRIDPLEKLWKAMAPLLEHTFRRVMAPRSLSVHPPHCPSKVFTTHRNAHQVHWGGESSPFISAFPCDSPV